MAVTCTRGSNEIRETQGSDARTTTHSMEGVSSDELLLFAERHRQRLHEQRIALGDVDAAYVARDVGGYGPQRERTK